MMRTTSIALAAALLLGSPLAATAVTTEPTATAGSTATTAGSRSGLPFMLGVFAHDKERAAKFEQVVGAKADLYQVFPDRGGGMTSTLASTWMFDGVPDGANLEIAADLWDAPASDWAAFATMIRDAGYAAPWITLGHEFNLPGGWEQAELTADEFKARFIRAHDAIKAVLPDATILWAPNTGQGGIPVDFYPGDQYVDKLGLSAYMWQSEDWLGQKGGMNDYAEFARSHGKTIFLREWGNAKPGADGRGDDPAAMDLTFDWAKANADVFAGVGYFDETADYFQSSVGAGQMPETGKRLNQIFASYGSSRAAVPETTQETAGNPAAAAQQASQGRDDGGAAAPTSSEQPGPEPQTTAATATPTDVPTAQTRSPWFKLDTGEVFWGEIRGPQDDEGGFWAWFSPLKWWGDTKPANPAPETTSAGEAPPSHEPAKNAAGNAVEATGAAFAASNGLTGRYHVSIPTGAAGLVVYFDGDEDGTGQKGFGESIAGSYVTGGPDGLAATAAAKGYGTLSLEAPGGERTWWRNGEVNVAYAADLIRKVQADAGLSGPVTGVGYSGGSQLLTKWGAPNHPDLFERLIVFGGGGAPSGDAPAGVTVTHVVGSADDGTGSSDGYDALSDAREGSAAYGGDLVILDGRGHGIGGLIGAEVAKVLPQAGKESR